jgi:hypothetical protein
MRIFTARRVDNERCVYVVQDLHAFGVCRPWYNVALDAQRYWYYSSTMYTMYGRSSINVAMY